MATRKTIQEAMDEEYLVLFDADVLISAYKAPRTNDPYAQRALDLLGAIEGSRRFTTELVRWLFLHPGHGSTKKEEIATRRTWLDDHLVKVRAKHPPGYLTTLEALTFRVGSRGDAVDGALAAYSVASKRATTGEFAIATADGDDFCWHKDIVVITDFFRGPACP